MKPKDDHMKRVSMMMPPALWHGTHQEARKVAEERGERFTASDLVREVLMNHLMGLPSRPVYRSELRAAFESGAWRAEGLRRWVNARRDATLARNAAGAADAAEVESAMVDWRTACGAMETALAGLSDEELAVVVAGLG